MLLLRIGAPNSFKLGFIFLRILFQMINELNHNLFVIMRERTELPIFASLLSEVGNAKFSFIATGVI